MLTIWLITAIIYGAIALGHFAFLYSEANKYGYNRDLGKVIFLIMCSIFWPLTWVGFIFSRN